MKRTTTTIIIMMTMISQRRSFELTRTSTTYHVNGTGEEAVPDGTWTTSDGYPYPSGPSSMDDDQVLIIYVFPVIVFAGTIGNTLSIAVLSRPCMRFASVYFYLLVLACADTMVLYISAFKTWIRLVTDFELLHFSNASCKILIFALLVSMTLSAWLVVFMTADRFVAVWFPFRAATFCNISRARVATIALLAASFALHCHVFWTFSLHRVGGSGQRSKLVCALEQPVMSRPFEYLKMTTYCVIPFIVILCLNIAIIVRLRSSSAPTTIQLSESRFTGRPLASSRMRSGHAPHYPSILRHMRDPYSQTRVTSMLLAVSFAWLLLTSPFTIYGIVAGLSERSNMVVKAVCFILMYTNHAINFGLYCLTGKKFRRELVELFGRMTRRRRRRSTPNTSPSVKTQRSSNVIELDNSLLEAEKHFRNIQTTTMTTKKKMRSESTRSRTHL